MTLQLGLAFGCSPSSPSIDEVRSLHAQARFEESIEPLRSLIEADPEDGAPLLLLSVALNRARKPGAAVWPLRRAQEIPDWQERATLALARLHLSHQNHLEAEREIERLIAQAGESTELLLLRAEIRLASRSGYEEALADLDRVLAEDPENVRALVPRAIALLGLGRVEEAGAALDALAARWEDEGALESPNGAFYCAALALFTFEKGEVDEALARVETCSERFPTDGNVIEQGLKISDGAGRYDRSLALLERALEASPEDLTLSSRLASRLHAMGRGSEGEALLLAATEAESRRVAGNAWIELARYRLMRSDYEGHALAFDEAMKLAAHPDAEMQFAYAEALVLAGRLDEAAAISEQIEVEAFRELVLARISYERGEAGQALVHYGHANLLWPDNPVARYYTARAAERQGNFDLAIEEYRASLRAGATETDACIRLARLHLAEGRPQAAQRALFHYTSQKPGDLEALELSLEISSPALDPQQLLVRLRTAMRAPAQLPVYVTVTARELARRGAADSAWRVLAEYFALAPGVATRPASEDALRELATAAIAAGHEAEALEVLGRAADGTATASAAWESIGRIREARRASSDDAHDAFAKALEANDENAWALAGMARAAANAGDAEAAALHVRAARLAEAPREAAIVADAARYLLTHGERAQAVELLEWMLVSYPYDATAPRLLVETRLQAGPPDASTLTLARRAQRFSPRDPSAIDFVERLEGEFGATPPPAPRGPSESGG